MVDNGTKTFGFVVNLAELPQTWTKPIWSYENSISTYDLSCIFERIEMTLKYCSNARFILRIYMGVPSEWLEENQDERCIMIDKQSEYHFTYDQSITTEDKNKQYVSIASNKWRNDAGIALTEAIKKIEEIFQDRVIAYCISGLSSEEWYHYGWHNNRLDDYSMHFKIKFQQWLKNKYFCIENLQKSWNNNSIKTFDDVKLPLYEQRISDKADDFYNINTEHNIIDFYQFYNWIIPDTISYFTKCAKKGAPNKVIGCLYGYQLEFGEVTSGHCGLGYLLKDKNIDYIMVETGYKNRRPALGGDNFRSAFTSFYLNNKLIINDNDTVTYKFEDIYKNNELKEWYRSQLGYAPNAELSAEVQKRIIGFAFCNGMTTTYFDLHGGYYDDNVILKTLKDAEKIYSESFKYDSTSAAQILIITDEKSDSFIRVKSVVYSNKMLSSQLNSIVEDFMKIGAPYDIMLLEDLDKVNFLQYKMVVVLNCYALSYYEYNMLQKIKTMGRTVIWGYADGMILSDVSSIKNISSLVDMNIQKLDKQETISLDFENQNTKLNKYIANIYSSTDKIKLYVDFESDIYYVSDNQADVVATMDNKDIVTMAIKHCENYCSIYTSTLKLTAQIWKAVASFAGVHIYSEKLDTIYANNQYITIHAIDNGVRIIKFPKTVKKVIEPISQIVLATDTNNIKLYMQKGETKYLHIL